MMKKIVMIKLLVSMNMINQLKLKNNSTFLSLMKILKYNHSVKKNSSTFLMMPLQNKPKRKQKKLNKSLKRISSKILKINNNKKIMMKSKQNKQWTNKIRINQKIIKHFYLLLILKIINKKIKVIIQLIHRKI